MLLMPLGFLKEAERIEDKWTSGGTIIRQTHFGYEPLVLTGETRQLSSYL